MINDVRHMMWPSRSPAEHVRGGFRSDVPDEALDQHHDGTS